MVRAGCTSVGPGLKNPCLCWLTLVWPRKDLPRRFTQCSFNWVSEPNTMTYCRCWCCCCVCTVVWYVVTKNAGWMRCSSCSLGPRARFHRQLAVWLRKGAGTAFVHASRLYLLYNESSATRTPVCTSCCCCRTGSAQLSFHLLVDRCYVSIESDGLSRQIFAQNLTTWAIGLFYHIPSDFEFIKKPIHFLDRKDKNWSSHLDRMRISLFLTSQRGSTELMYGIYWSVQEASGTGVDVVRIPVPTSVPTSTSVTEVPVLMLYRTYRSVRYRYCCRT